MRHLLLIALLLVLAPLTAGAAPAIRFDDLSYASPVISQTDMAEHTFGFVNSGDSELVIEDIAPS
ncbi:MAG: hypothetical protein M0Z60_12885 [Nitrospiraceae bacterium]|nr:hypothetical protein [Nitrospiraceae bacterium]